jgi:hypothetical protein
MTQDDDVRDRLMIEVYRLRHEMYTCAHCAALREQIIRLYNVLPAVPFVVTREEAAAFKTLQSK